MPQLHIDSVEVRFGALTALAGIDIAVESSAVTGIVGPPGAGKTTLCNVVAGNQRPRAGRIVLGGQDVTTLAPHRRARLGLARTFEQIEVMEHLTVRENILVAAEIRRRWARDGINSMALTEEVMGQVGLRALSRVPCDMLPPGTTRLVEVARALATRPSVLVLDAPTGGLNQAETANLLALLGKVAADGVAVLLVEQDLATVADACHYVYALGGGRVLAAGTPEDIGTDPAMRAATVDAAANPASKRRAPVG